MNAEYPWHKSYPQGVAHEVNVDTYSSLVELLEHCFKKYADRDAYIHMGNHYTYAELEQQSRRFASFLQNHTVLEPGDAIAIQMPNVMQYPVVMFGALRAGMRIVNTNPLYTPREMLHQLEDSGAKAIVILDNFADKLEHIVKKTSLSTIITTGIGDLMPFPKRLLVNFVVKYVKKMVPSYNLPNSLTLNDALKQGETGQFQPVEIKPHDTAFLQYTGGTTGVAKGAELTHRNILANLSQMSEWMKYKLEERAEFVVTPLPLYHIFSLTANCFIFFAIGGTNLLITNPRDIPAFIKELNKYKFTAITGVNTLFNALLNTPEFASVDFSNLKLAVGGGMAVQRVIGERWHRVTGQPLCEGYGLTESSPVLCCNPLDGNEQLGTIGMPMPSTEIKIMKEDGTEAEIGEPGEICGRGPQVMKGYLGRPEATAETITKDGWLRTGDIGLIQEDGFIRIVDRKKDMILVSGFNVFPNEVEDVIAMQEKVLEVAAVGVPDEKSTEAVKVFVVKKDPSLTLEELRAYCKENLTGYKVPKHYEFREDLPKSNVGKILRRHLREEGIKR